MMGLLAQLATDPVRSDSLALVPCTVLAAALAMATWWLIRALTTEDVEQEAEWRYDISRINALRQNDSVFRLFQPLLQFLARLNRAACRPQLPEVYREIQAAGLTRFWLPEEYLARGQVIALLMAPAYLFLCLTYMGMAGIVSACVLTVVTAWLIRRSLTRRSRRRLVIIKRRLPFFLDLMTLLMEAGSTFLQSLGQSVEELRGHPVAEEFGRVLVDIHLGKTRHCHWSSI